MNKVLSNPLSYSFKNKAQELTAIASKAAETAKYANDLIPSATVCLDRTKSPCDLTMIRPVPTPVFTPLLSDVGGCYSWTDDGYYCLEYRVRGFPDSTYAFSATMKPGPWVVRAVGPVYRTTHPHDFGDINPVMADIELKAQDQSVKESGTWAYRDTKIFDVTLPNVTANTDGIKGSLVVTKCVWVNPQHCSMSDMTITITPPSAPAPASVKELAFPISPEKIMKQPN
jgi:hypothetical protein